LKPTQGLVRAAIFNILGDTIRDARVGDFFCAAGSLGIEALSRGARSVLFIDNDPEALRYLKRNLAALPRQAQIRRGDVAIIIARLADVQFDIVFLDPPYGKGLVRKVIEKILTQRLLAPDGLIVVEHSAKEPGFACDGLAFLKERVYGDTIISILKEG